MKKFAIAGVVVMAFAVSACLHAHHHEPAVVKGFSPVAEAPALGVAPAADWK